MSTFVCGLDKDHIEDAMEFSTREGTEQWGRLQIKLWNKNRSPIEDTFGYVDEELGDIKSFVVAQIIQPTVDAHQVAKAAIDEAQNQIDIDDPDDYSVDRFGQREVKSLEKYIQAWLEDTGLIDFPYFNVVYAQEVQV